MVDILIDNEFYDEVEKFFKGTGLDAEDVIEDMARAFFDKIYHDEKLKNLFIGTLQNEYL